MFYISFYKSKLWGDFPFEAGKVYRVGPRVHAKFVSLQGAAYELEEVPPGCEPIVVPDPGEEINVEERVLSKPAPDVSGESAEIKIVHRGGPWFDVHVNGVIWNDHPMKKDEAEQTEKILHETINQVPAPDPVPAQDT